MKIEWDDKNNQKIFHMNTKEIGLLLFGLDLAMTVTSSTKVCSELTALRQAILEIE